MVLCLREREVTKDPDLDQALESHVQTIEHLVTDSTTDFDGESDGSSTRPGTNTPGSFKLTYRGQEFVPQKSASEHVEQGKKCNRRKERPPPPFTEAQRGGQARRRRSRNPMSGGISPMQHRKTGLPDYVRSSQQWKASCEQSAS